MQDSRPDAETPEPGVESKEEEGVEEVEEEKPLPPEDWLQQIVRPPEPPPWPEQERQQEPPQPLSDEDTMLADADLQRIKRLEAELESTKQGFSQTEQVMDRMARSHVERTVLTTASAVHRDIYNGAFAKDKVLQGNEEAAQFADKMMQGLVGRAAWEAREFGDMTRLNNILTDPKRLGRHVASIARTEFGLSGANTPVQIKGAEVESAAKPSAAPDSRSHGLSKAERAVLKKYGISEDQHFEDAKVVGTDFSDYDYEEVE